VDEARRPPAGITPARRRPSIGRAATTPQQQAIARSDAPPSFLPACNHRAGNERVARKALASQAQPDPVFDGCAGGGDGAPVGSERRHAHKVAPVIASAGSRFGRVGIRIDDMSHRRSQKDPEVILPAAGPRVADATLPKGRGVATVEAVAARVAACASRWQPIPPHAPIDLPPGAAPGRIDRHPPAAAVVPRADPARLRPFGSA
jgi:citrate lyase subunit beta/citryl-CoA lyase